MEMDKNEREVLWEQALAIHAGEHEAALSFPILQLLALLTEAYQQGYSDAKGAEVLKRWALGTEPE